jgi:hypothetical protein
MYGIITDLVGRTRISVHPVDLILAAWNLVHLPWTDPWEVWVVVRVPLLVLMVVVVDPVMMVVVVPMVTGMGPLHRPMWVVVVEEGTVGLRHHLVEIMVVAARMVVVDVVGLVVAAQNENEGAMPLDHDTKKSI